MTPGDAARAAGVPVSTLRYYERRGLVVPERDERSGYRRYTEDDVRRVRFVRRAQQLGFGMADVTAFFALTNEGAEGAALSTAALARVVDAKLADLDERIADLARMRDALRVVADGVYDEDCLCPVVAALGQD